jgi:NADPH:quinone reductase-like Zn-dependent oxidoreductase
VRPGSTVLIHGASGGVGTFAVQIARAFGADVSAVCSQRSADAARALGAGHVVDYGREDFGASPRRYDVIVGVNGDRSILDYRRALAPGGRYVALGGSMRQIVQGMLFGPLLSLIGGKRLGFMGISEVDRTRLQQLAAMVASGALAPVIDRSVPLAEAPQALAQLAEGHARGKVVIELPE